MGTTTSNHLLPTQCIYQLNQNSEKLCSLWCSLQIYQGKSCQECPKIYMGDPEEELLCNLWFELQKLNANGPPMQMELEPVACLYSHNPSGVKLCHLWCQIQNYNGRYCIDCPDPYRSDYAKDLLCNLYEQLVMLQSSNNSSQPSLDMPVSCLYEYHNTSASLLCDLWCEIQTFTGKYCVECPDHYKVLEFGNILCELYIENELLGDQAGVSTSLTPVTCIYENYLHNADKLCFYWCQIQAKRYELGCIQCPQAYKNDVEHKLLCFFYSELVKLQANGNNVIGGQNGVEYVNCPYIHNPTSSGRGIYCAF